MCQLVKVYGVTAVSGLQRSRWVREGSEMQMRQTGEAASRVAVMEKLAPWGYWSLCEGLHWWAHAPIRRAAMVRRTFPSAQRQQLDTSTVVRSEPELPMAR